MQLVGIRELKNRLTHYLSLIKKGENVVVTHRGNPIAILHSLDQTEVSASPDEKLAALAKEGMIKLPLKERKIDMATKAVPIKGKPLSRIVIEERR